MGLGPLTFVEGDKIMSCHKSMYMFMFFLILLYMNAISCVAALNRYFPKVLNIFKCIVNIINFQMQ